MAKRGRRKKKKTSKKAGKKRARRATAPRRRGRPSALASASVDDLRAELGRRVGDLESRRDELSAELRQVEADISDLRGAVGGAAPSRRGRPAGSTRRSAAGARGARRGRRRASNKQSLADALKTLLTGATMSVTEMADAVQKAGYKTKSAGNFRTIVNQTLIRDPKTFKRVGRGMYTAK